MNKYEYSFSEEVVNRHLSPEEWWFERHFPSTLSTGAFILVKGDVIR